MHFRWRSQWFWIIRGREKHTETRRRINIAREAMDFVDAAKKVREREGKRERDMDRQGQTERE